MGDVLRRTGANFTLLFPDDRTNTTLNSSTPGADGIATTNFEGMLFEDGEIVATNLAALEAGPYNMTIDNVSGTFGVYKVNISLPNRAMYDLFLRHTTAIVTVRQEQFDTTTRDEFGSVSRGNTKLVFRTAASDNGAQKAAAGVLEEMDVITRYAGDADFSSPLSTVTLKFFYQSLGDTNPIRVSLT